MKNELVLYGIFYNDFSYESTPQLKLLCKTNDIAKRELEKLMPSLIEEAPLEGGLQDGQVYIKPIEVITD